ncbi:hypothetical protein OMD46_09255 [Pseudomonas sp. MDMC_285]|nr:hypothetical protein [Pseudomonas sp. MDMC_285]
MTSFPLRQPLLLGMMRLLDYPELASRRRCSVLSSAAWSAG